jgi:nucleotide-binding universal stress UspA family protein
MERILVGMDLRQSSLEGVHRAIQLATRIDATVTILLVSSPADPHTQQDILQQLEHSVRKRLELLVEMGRADGVEVNFYVTQGDYREEVIRFTQQNQITHVVLGLPRGGPQAAAEFQEWLDGIRHRISCRIELVQEKSGRVHEGSRR